MHMHFEPEEPNDQNIVITLWEKAVEDFPHELREAFLQRLQQDISKQPIGLQKQVLSRIAVLNQIRRSGGGKGHIKRIQVQPGGIQLVHIEIDGIEFSVFDTRIQGSSGTTLQVGQTIFVNIQKVTADGMIVAYSI